MGYQVDQEPWGDKGIGDREHGDLRIWEDWGTGAGAPGDLQRPENGAGRYLGTGGLRGPGETRGQRDWEMGSGGHLGDRGPALQCLPSLCCLDTVASCTGTTLPSCLHPLILVGGTGTR